MLQVGITKSKYTIIKKHMSPGQVFEQGELHVDRGSSYILQWYYNSFNLVTVTTMRLARNIHQYLLSMQLNHYNRVENIKNTHPLDDWMMVFRPPNNDGEFAIVPETVCTVVNTALQNTEFTHST